MANWAVGDAIETDLPFELPDVTLQSGEFVVVWASGGEGDDFADFGSAGNESAPAAPAASGGAGGAHNNLFLDLKTLSKVLRSHFFSPKYFKHPTIDLTCCCKNDCDLNSISILFFKDLILLDLMVLLGLFAWQLEDLNVE